MTREEAIKAIKAWGFLGNNEKEVLETLIPELKESEDERISREITEFILTHRIDEPNDIEDTNSWLAWLEKQGEQKDINPTLLEKEKWSEEDDCYMSECVSAIATKDGWSFEEKTKTKHWLKSLKQRMEKQQ